MKLTEEILHKLILEEMKLLNEREIIKIKIPNSKEKRIDLDTQTPTKVFKTTGVNKNAFRQLAGEDGEPKDFTTDDLYQALVQAPETSAQHKAALRFKDSDRVKVAYKKAAEDAYNAAQMAAPEKVSDIDAFDPDKPTGIATSDDISSMAFKQLQTVAADPKDPTEMGKFPEGLATAVDVVFAGINNFESRINKISELTQKIYIPKGGRGGGYAANAQDIVKDYDKPSDLLAAVLFLDYVTTVIKEIDAGAAAYQFESMLALLSGGRVTGKLTTAGGKMSAADFVTNKNVKGSAKYYSNVSKSQITQAATGFDVNTPYVYIVAHKKATTKGGSLSTGASTPQDIVAVDIYTFSIMTPDKINFIVRNSSGTQVFLKKDGSNKLKLGGDQVLTNPMTLIVEKDTKTKKAFRQQLIDGVGKKFDLKRKKALEAYDNISKNSYIADQKLKVFMSTGEDGAGNDALRAMMAVETGISLITPIVTTPKQKYKQQIKKGIGGVNLEENDKLDEKALDKIIKEVILTK